MTGTAAVFLYGTLRHIPLLQAVLGRAPDLVPARLVGHSVMRVAGASFPAIRTDPLAEAEGVLLSDTSAADVARLDYYEGAYHYVLRAAQVETADGPAEAMVYFPDDEMPPGDGPWSLEEWAAAHGRATNLAAREVMAVMDRLSPDEVRRCYERILARAWSAVRAEDAPAPATLRRALASGEVAVAQARLPYLGYFGVAEQDLRFPTFEGGQSAEVTRAAFLMGDAVTVLPYDPLRDRVALIEQFRFGPMMRGDPLPWSLEPVAGRIDPGEATEDAARRETAEETGLHVGKLYRVGAYYPSPGAVTEHLISYVGIAEIPDDAGGIGGLDNEAEDILTHVIDFDRLMALVESGEAATGPLILSAQWLALNRDRLRPGQGVA